MAVTKTIQTKHERERERQETEKLGSTDSSFIKGKSWGEGGGRDCHFVGTFPAFVPLALLVEAERK